ncbi:MAG: hypothetical protein EU536_01090 [Promethearchaeota archaeon]|nr:MAG: hypothetical protein EU536_01090 [Candidatus Lokiarchaeota archaeon]
MKKTGGSPPVKYLLEFLKYFHPVTICIVLGGDDRCQISLRALPRTSWFLVVPQAVLIKALPLD